MVLKDTIANSIISLEEAIETLNEGEGEESVQIGARANASGSKTVSIGADSLSMYSGSIALGVSASAAQHGSIAIGSGSSIYQDDRYWYGGSIAIGEKAKASNMAAIGIGCDANAGQNGIAIGSGSNASYGAGIGVSSYANQYSVSIGNNSRAEGFYSVSVGQGSKALDGSGVAIGNNSTIGAEYSVGVGLSTRIGRFSINSIAVGRGTTVGTSDFQYSTGSIAIGAQSTIENRAPLNTLLGTQSAIMTGSAYSIVLGPRSQVSGSNSIVIGNNLTSSKDNQGILGNDAVQWEVPGSMFVSGALSTIEPVSSENVATKGYVDANSGGGGDASLLTSNDANTFITASNDSLLVGFDQYSKKLAIEEIDPDSPEIMLSKSIETWDDIASDQVIWGNVDGFGSAFMRTNHAFVEDSNNKSWGFQFINNVFEGHSHQGINISQGDNRLTFATVDTSSGDFYLASETFAEDYWSRLDIRKDNIEIRASKDYNEISFRIDPSGSSTNKPLDMGNNRITNVEDPMFLQDVATKAYVDSQSGGGGGGTPGHVICNVTEDDPPLEPVPQRKNLVFFSDTADITVTDFEELDTTIVNFLSIPEYPPDIYQGATDDPSGRTYAQAMVDAFYTEGEGSAAFQIWLADHNGESSHLHFERKPEGERFMVALGYQPGDLVFEVNDHTSYGDKEFRLLNAPTLIETPVKPDHAATKGYVDASRSDLEWWTPSWTPVENVGSVSNVECQYTRTYRAASGSLVTLEGTIEVTPVAGDARSTASAILPVPRVGTDIIGGVATYTDYNGDDFGVARVGIADLGAGHQFTVQYTPDTSVVHRVSFRISYRAA